tara:strand:- start:327 stop:536 length:210 start_codon:yes stop_codon:yes gene_type:complete
MATIFACNGDTARNGGPLRFGQGQQLSTRCHHCGDAASDGWRDESRFIMPYYCAACWSSYNQPARKRRR